MNPAWCKALPDGVRLTLQVAPNARKTAVAGVLDDVLRVRLQAQPIEGRANEALVRFLSDVLKVPRSVVRIVHGQGSKRKTVDIAAPGLDTAEVARLLLEGSE